MMEWSRIYSNSFGYLRLPEVDLLKNVARRVKAVTPVMVNIGIGAATSLACLLEARPGAEIVAVDIDPHVGHSQLEQMGVRHLVRRITGDSKVVGKHWEKPIDLLFIDGDHSTEGVRGDIEIWTPHLAESGVVLLHDYDGVFWPDVKTAVDTLLAGWYQVGLAETLIALSRFDTHWLEI